MNIDFILVQNKFNQNIVENYKCKIINSFEYEKYKKIKRIREKLQNRQVSLGTWQQIPDASVSELLGSIGFDWVTVDMEHGSNSVELTNMCEL